MGTDIVREYIIPTFGLLGFNLFLNFEENGNSSSLIKSSINLGAHMANPLIIPRIPTAIKILTTPNTQP
jgi:hypothetical protein